MMATLLPKRTTQKVTPFKVTAGSPSVKGLSARLELRITIPVFAKHSLSN